MPSYRVFITESLSVDIQANSVSLPSAPDRIVFKNENQQTVAEFLREKIIGYTDTSIILPKKSS